MCLIYFSDGFVKNSSAGRDNLIQISSEKNEDRQNYLRGRFERGKDFERRRKDNFKKQFFKKEKKKITLNNGNGEEKEKKEKGERKEESC